MYYFVVTLFCYCHIALVQAGERTMGSYYTKVVSIENCRLNPLQKPSCQDDYKFTPFQNGTLVHGYYNAKCSYKGNLRGNIYTYYEKNGRYKLVQKFSNLRCTNLIMQTLFELTKIRVDNQRCTLIKGNYTVSSYNADLVFHQVANVMPYGKYKVILNWFVSEGYVCCVISYVVIAEKP